MLSPYQPSELRKLATVHLLGWSLLHIALFFPTRDLAVMNGDGALEAAAYEAAKTVIDILVSGAMGAVYLALPERHLRGLRAVMVLLIVTTTAAFCEHMLRFLWNDLTGIGPFGPVDRRYNFNLLFAVRIGMQYGTWSALFLTHLFSQRVQQAQKREFEANLLAQEAKLELLRSQINPHFLFNSLNSVVGLCIERPPLAQEMVIDISALLRRSLESHHAQLCTIQEEFDFAELYLRCEQKRFEERLKYTLDIGDTATSSCPTMILQPLIENAIKHGLHATNTLNIHITSKFTKRGIQIEVRNNGTMASGDRTGTQTGIRNISDRLRTLYPNTGKFSLNESKGEVCAQLTFHPEDSP